MIIVYTSFKRDGYVYTFRVRPGRIQCHELAVDRSSRIIAPHEFFDSVGKTVAGVL